MIIFSHTTNGAETERSFKIFAAILICLEHRKKIKMHIDDFLDKDHNLAKKNDHF
jgi:hypothetical protein